MLASLPDSPDQAFMSIGNHSGSTSSNLELTSLEMSSSSYKDPNPILNNVKSSKTSTCRSNSVRPNNPTLLKEKKLPIVPVESLVSSSESKRQLGKVSLVPIDSLVAQPSSNKPPAAPVYENCLINVYDRQKVQQEPSNCTGFKGTDNVSIYTAGNQYSIPERKLSCVSVNLCLDQPFSNNQTPEPVLKSLINNLESNKNNASSNLLSIQKSFDLYKKTLESRLSPELYLKMTKDVELAKCRKLSAFEVTKLKLGIYNIVKYWTKAVQPFTPLTNPALETKKFIDLMKLAEKSNTKDSDVDEVRKLLMTPDRADSDFVRVNVSENLLFYHRLRSNLFNPLLARYDFVVDHLIGKKGYHNFDTQESIAFQHMLSLHKLSRLNLYLKLEENFDFQFLELLEKYISRRTVSCPSCPVQCQNLLEVVHHYGLTHYFKKFESLIGNSSGCNDCMKPFHDRTRLIKHLALVHNRILIKYVSWSCKLCNFESHEKSAMFEHLKISHNIIRDSEMSQSVRMEELKNLQCSDCMENYSFSDMKNHVFDKHYRGSFERLLSSTVSPTSKCDFCEADFFRQSDWKILITRHYAVEHNFIYRFLHVYPRGTIQITFNSLKPFHKPITKKEEEDVIIIDDYTQSDSLRQDVEDEILMSGISNKTDNMKLASLLKTKRRDTLQCCHICKRKVLKNKMISHMLSLHYLKQLKKELEKVGMHGKNQTICKLCNFSYPFPVEMHLQTHYAIKHSKGFLTFLNKFLGNDGSEKDLPEFNDSSEDNFDTPIPERFASSVKVVSIVQAETSPWVENFKQFCEETINEPESKETVNLNFTITNPLILERYLESVIKKPANIAILDKIINQLEDTSSITLAKLQTVKRYLLLKDYLTKCTEASSTIYNIPLMHVVIFLSQMMTKPEIAKDDICWLMKKISDVHEFVNGKPIGMDDKIIDFFKAIGYPVDHTYFELPTQVPKPIKICCTKCPDSFKTNKALSVHILRHTNLNIASTPKESNPHAPETLKVGMGEATPGRYKCSEVTKVFTNKEKLQIHSKMHSSHQPKIKKLKRKLSGIYQYIHHL